jgi:ABC-type uncharacterized transport system permease subunit
MLEKLITVSVALICLAYYIKSNWPGIKNRRLILILLFGGILVFLVGVALNRTEAGPTLRLLGTCIFFSGVAIDAGIARKKSKD